MHPFGFDIPFQMKVVLVGCSCDLPARALILNMNQFNGYYGCWYCQQSGKTYATSNGGHVHIFPFDTKMPLRDVETWKQHAKEAVDNQQQRKSPVRLDNLKAFIF